jgi:hypothetical protein
MNIRKHMPYLLLSTAFLLLVSVVNAAMLSGSGDDNQNPNKRKTSYQDDQDQNPSKSLKSDDDAAAATQEQELETCRICLETITSDKQLLRLACNHQFDVDCIVEWLKINDSCPLCKTKADLEKVQLSDTEKIAIHAGNTSEAQADRQMIEELELNSDTEINLQGYLLAAIQDEHPVAVRVLLAHQPIGTQIPISINTPIESGMTMLHVAAYLGHTAIVQCLLTQPGIIINPQEELFGQTPLFLAAAFGHLGVVQSLAAHNADIHQTNTQGVSPLWRVAQNGHLAIVQCLQQHGASLETPVNHPNNVINRFSYIHIAALQGDLALLQLCLQCNANLNLANNPGASTPLQLAAIKGRLEVVQFLVTHGANVHATNQVGLTAHAIALHFGHIEAANFLSGIMQDQAGALPVASGQQD